NDLVRHKLRLAAYPWQLLGSSRRRLDRWLVRGQRPPRNPSKRDRSPRRASAGKDASAQLLPACLAKAAAVANTSCDADDVDGRGDPPYSARKRQRLAIVGLAVVVLAATRLAIVGVVRGLAIVGVWRAAITGAPDLARRGVVVLMIVRMLIGVFARSMRPRILRPESSQALSSPLPHEREVWRLVDTGNRADRQRFGAVVSGGRQQKRDNDQRGRDANWPSQHRTRSATPAMALEQ